MYLDIDIAILPRSGDTYPFTLHAPGGDARGVFVFPEDADFHQLQMRLAALETDEGMLTEIGRRLFTALFHDQARDVLARTQGMRAQNQRLRLRLSISAEEGKIAALPWELLDNPDAGPLVLTDTPIVRYIPMAARVPTVATPLPLQVLLTGASAGAANVAPVLHEIQAALATLGDHAQVTVEPALTMQTFQRRLREGYHVWHHVGQAGTSDATGVLLFSGGGNNTRAVSASQLAVLLGSSGMRLVVLDASAGARLATDSFRTIAPALMKIQIPTVVAMQFSAPNESSQTFAGEFYRSLAEGLPIDACVTEGRRAVMGWSGIDRADWATPVVYSRAPDSQLFSVPRADLEGRIVTLASVPGLPPHTTVTVDTKHGTLLHAGPRPSVERLAEKPRPPRPVRAFLNRERELRTLLAEIEPRQGAWVRGAAGAGISALLRQAANAEKAAALPDGVVLLNSTLDSADVDDAVQEIFNRFYVGNVPVKLSADGAKSYLGGLRALFMFDRLPLSADNLSMLADTLAESAVLVAANGPAPDTLQEVTLGALPRQEATKLIGAEAGTEIDLSNVMFLDRICAALGDIPLALQLAGRLLQTNAVPLKQLVALTEESNQADNALAHAARISLQALSEHELKALAAVVRGGPAGISSEATADIAQIAPPQVDAALERLSELRLVEGGNNRYAPATVSLGRVLDRLLQPGDERKRAAAFFAGAALLHAGNLDWLTTEEANLLQAAETLLANGQANQAGALLQTIQPAAVLHGKWGMWNYLATLAERAAVAANDPALRAWALHERGTRAALLGDRTLAQTALGEAARVRETANNDAGIAWSQHNLRHAGFMSAPPLAPLVHTPAPVPKRIVAAVVAISIVLAILALLAPRVGWPFSTDQAITTAIPEPAPVAIVATEPATATATNLPAPTPLSTAPPPTGAPTATATSEPTQCQVVAARLNVRRGPGTEFPAVATLTDGQTITPTGRSADNAWVRITAEGVADGWVSANTSLLACNTSVENLNLSEAPPAPTLTRRPTVRPIRPTFTPEPPSVTPTNTQLPPTAAPPTLTSTLTPILTNSAIITATLDPELPVEELPPTDTPTVLD